MPRTKINLIRKTEMHGCASFQLEKGLTRAKAHRSIRSRNYRFKLKGFYYNPTTGKASVYG